MAKINLDKSGLDKSGWHADSLELRQHDRRVYRRAPAAARRLLQSRALRQFTATAAIRMWSMFVAKQSG